MYLEYERFCCADCPNSSSIRSRELRSARSEELKSAFPLCWQSGPHCSGVAIWASGLAKRSWGGVTWPNCSVANSPSFQVAFLPLRLFFVIFRLKLRLCATRIRLAHSFWTNFSLFRLGPMWSDFGTMVRHWFTRCTFIAWISFFRFRSYLKIDVFHTLLYLWHSISFSSKMKGSLNTSLLSKDSLSLSLTEISSKSTDAVYALYLSQCACLFMP